MSPIQKRHIESKACFQYRQTHLMKKIKRKRGAIPNDYAPLITLTNLKRHMVIDEAERRVTAKVKNTKERKVSPDIPLGIRIAADEERKVIPGTPLDIRITADEGERDMMETRRTQTGHMKRDASRTKRRKGEDPDANTKMITAMSMGRDLHQIREARQLVGPAIRIRTYL